MKKIDETQYGVFVNTINEQLEKMFEIWDNLYGAVADKKNQSVMMNLAEAFAGLTATHFSIVEKYMMNSKYPEYMAHKKEHDVFLKKVSEFRDDIDFGRYDNCVKNHRAIRDALIKHIDHFDVPFGKFLAALG